MLQVENSRKEEILLRIKDILKEEKWTRATIDSYSVKNFIELDDIIRNAIEEGLKDEIKNICRENLKHSPNSVVSLYIFGVLSLEESAVDDTHLPQIIKIFMDNKKYKIAEFLANKILLYREHKFALKTLETIYESYGNQEELFNIKRRLVLVDNKDAMNAKLLGEYYENEGDKELAMFYYRLALERVIVSRLPKLVEELWGKIIKLFPDDPELVINIGRKIREVLGDSRTADIIYNDFVKRAMKNGRYKEALMVIKFILDLKPHEKSFRKAIEDCYREIYKGHSELEKYLKMSSISQSWKPHKEAIRLFESHIAFDKGVYVFHKTWGVGVVVNIEGDKITVDFEQKKNHIFSLEIALRALQVLDNDHILIWKKYRIDEFKKLVWEDPLRVLEIILKSNKNSATLSQVKEYLCPDLISQSDWTKWWNKAKKEISSSDRIIQSISKRNLLELRESEIPIEDELISKFKKTTNFDNKLKLLIDFRLQGGNINDEKASALVNYFTEILHSENETPEKKVASWVALEYAGYKDLKNENLDVSEIFKMRNVVEFYTKLELELKKTFIDLIMRMLKDWYIKFSDFILNSPLTRVHKYMIDMLEANEKYEIIADIYISAMNSFQEKPDIYVWLSKILLEEENHLLERLGIRETEIIIRYISLIDILSEEIEKKNNIGRNKKVLETIYDLLFKKGKLKNLIENSDEVTVKSILTLIESSSNFDPDRKAEFLELIYSTYPSLKKVEVREKPLTIRHPFLVTRKSLESKKKELEQIITVEIPENSKAIGEAMEKGDLRENAEYKAALERQDQLKAMVAKLQSEISQARVIERNQVNTSFVDVGTKVTVKNKEGKILSYEILGQWDVDLERNRISYHSPLGKVFLDKKVGEKVELEIEGKKQEWEIISIELADFE